MFKYQNSSFLMIGCNGVMMYNIDDNNEKIVDVQQDEIVVNKPSQNRVNRVQTDIQTVEDLPDEQ